MTFGFNPVDYPVSEGSPANLVVVLTGQTDIPVTVDLTTQDGSAVGECGGCSLELVCSYVPRS